jgi:hypothetical protein
MTRPLGFVAKCKQREQGQQAVAGRKEIIGQLSFEI